jgi:hypothetical protein
VKTLGIVAIGCYAIHATLHLLQGRPEDLLWACHLGALVVGIGLLIPSPSINAIGTFWLCFGTPLWLIDLATGGEFFPTSIFTHVMALGIGVAGIRTLGLPKNVWWKATGAAVALILISRFVTPAEANVNLAFEIPAASQKLISSHFAYLVFMIGAASLYYFGLEWAFRRWLTPSKNGREGT